MEQLKTAIGWLKQNYFWIVCGLLGILLIISSYTAANRFRAERLKGENNIRSAVATVKNVMGTSAAVGDQSVKVHPNQMTVDGMQAEVSEALKVAAQAWKLRRSAQEGLYKWPDVLGAHKKTFEKLPWPEYIPPPNYTKSGSKKPTGDVAKELEIPGISSQVLEVYGREIRRVMPEIAAIIAANWKYAGNESPTAETAPDAGASATGGTTKSGSDSKSSQAGVKVKKYVVQWNPKDQDRWYEMVTSFRTISIEDRPTLIGAVYIQENLWLLESLFRIIKLVNGEADANDIAAIKAIDHIYFGRDAQGLTGEIAPVNMRLFLEARAGKAERTLSPPAAVETPAPKSSTSSENSFDPADQRFVDENYQPIDATTVRDAVKADRLGQSAALTVAKRIPFRIGFTMDERKIPAFLAACANSPFRFETRQVRINRHDSSKLEGADGRQSDGADNTVPNLGASGGASPSSLSSAVVASASASTRTNYDVRVEFYGFVKIYNPMNHKILETQPDETATSEPAVATEGTNSSDLGTIHNAATSTNGDVTN